MLFNVPVDIGTPVQNAPAEPHVGAAAPCLALAFDRSWRTAPVFRVFCRR
jgi:hypothetical protein